MTALGKDKDKDRHSPEHSPELCLLQTPELGKKELVLPREEFVSPPEVFVFPREEFVSTPAQFQVSAVSHTQLLHFPFSGFFFF